MSSERARAESGHGIFHPTIVIDGQIVGTWSRQLRKASVRVAIKPFGRLDLEHMQALVRAAQRYADHLELPPPELHVAGHKEVEHLVRRPRL